MRGAAATMRVLRPSSAREAVAAYGRAPDAAPIAGGTDFMVAWNMGLLNGRAVLDLSGVGEWRGIVKFDGGLRVGALTTHAEIQGHGMLRREFPLLAQACSTIGASQIQNRGTLGGNIANASPAGDSFPALAVYEAFVRTVSPRGERRVPFLEVFAGVKETTLGPSELISSVELPFLSGRPSRRLFRKVGTRAAQAISKTVAAGLLWIGKDGRVEELRFALGSMAPTVRRLRRVEDFVGGRKLAAETAARACELLDEDVSPIDDIRSTREYRLRCSQNILRAFLEGK